MPMCVGKPLITIDYSLPVSEVFRETAIHIFQQEQNSATLAYCGSSRNKVLSPSWVPDFSASGNHHVAIRPTSINNCYFGSPITFENNMSRLAVAGVIFDHVCHQDSAPRYYYRYQKTTLPTSH